MAARQLAKDLDHLRRRVSNAATTAVLEAVARVGRLHPVADPKRHGVSVERDIEYGGGQLDIYRPVARARPWPVVFYVHGGAFSLLSKDTHWLMALVFARFGYLVVNISYRLAPTHPFPAALEDTCTAWRWLADRVEMLGGDPQRIAVAGESAGANLVTALTLAACEPRPEPWARSVYERGLVPRVVMPFCGMLEAGRPQRFSARRKLPRWIDGMIHEASTSYLHGHPVGGAPGSPTALADPLCVLEEAGRAHHEFARTLPPFFAPVGTRDPLLDDTRRLEKALAQLNVLCEARYYPGGIHAFHALLWDPAARRCWRDALAFLDRHMRPL